jgi:drug/metabolite transporter (DMT)-like permease
VLVRSRPAAIALGVAVLAVSSSAPLIVYAAAPALAIAFWRNALAVGVLAPAAALRRRPELGELFRAHRRAAAASLVAGVALAIHFATWVPSARLTSIAGATALVATQPVWQGLIAVGQGRHLPGGTWLGIAVAVTGAVVATGADFSVSADAVRGDLLALFAAMASAAYTALGERARAAISTTSYTALCYSVCAVVLLATCAAARVPLAGYPATTWLAILAMTIGPQLLGHSLFNFSLRRFSATTVSVVILLEVPGAALLGWVWLGQAPPATAWPGLCLLVAGVAIVALSARTGVRRAGLADSTGLP